MKLQVLNRKVHYWLAIVVAIPSVIILCTGILLQLKKQVPWVQPPEQKGSGSEPKLAMQEILAIVMSKPEAEVTSWKDINRIEFRPNRGMCKVWCKNDWEVQINTETGDVLQVAYRRSDFIESIHDGSLFTDWVKLGIWLPAGVILLTMWFTGMYLFWLPIYVKWRRKRASAAAPPPSKEISVAKVAPALTKTLQ